MRIIGAMLVRNESDRWLTTVLSQMHFVCDDLVVLDDSSTDDTVSICRRYTDDVHESPESLWGRNELVQRQRLWCLATQSARHGDWILCLDADEIFADGDPEQLKMLLHFRHIKDADSLGFVLHDMWTDSHYRSDHLWTAHTRLWPMAVKYDAERQYIWHESALHCGRFPRNAATALWATNFRLKHMGWSRPADRRAKYQRYLAADPDGKFGIMEQYASILDPHPNLVEFAS